ncbi:Ku protein [Streptomyces sp. M10(2022)]
MRSIWNGAISFGLVSIPVKLISATENHSISFRQIHLEDGGRIRYRKVCELDEQEVTTAETVKAYEDADGTVIPITDEDLASLPLNTAKTIEIVGFVPATAIDPLQLDAAYYLSANGVPAAKPYVLLREALRRSEKVAVAKYALRGRERLGMLRAADDVIAMHGLLWPDEIRAPEGVAPESGVRVRDAELDLADALMNTLGEADLDTLHDDYREAVEELVAQKAAGEAPEPQEPEDSDGGKVIDLMAALESSVRAAKEAHGEDGEGGEDGEEVADVHPIKSRGDSGGRARKTTRRTPTGKTVTRSGSATAGKSTPKQTGAKKSTATSKRTPEKKTPETKAKAAEKPAAKSSSAKSSTAKPTSKKTASSGRGTSKKSAPAPRKRTSA